MPYQLLPDENAFQDLIDEANRPKENAFAHLIPANHKNAFEHLIPKKGESSPNTFVFRGKDGGRYTVNAPGMTEAQAFDWFQQRDKARSLPKQTGAFDDLPMAGERKTAFDDIPKKGEAKDYAAMAAQFGGKTVDASQGVDYEAIAKQFGGTTVRVRRGRHCRSVWRCAR